MRIQRGRCERRDVRRDDEQGMRTPRAVAMDRRRCRETEMYREAEGELGCGRVAVKVATSDE